MKVLSLLFFFIPARAFVPVAHHRASTTLQATVSTQEQQLNEKLEFVGRKLKLECYDVDTSVYGFDSKDYHYGIESLRVKLPFEPSLGLDLTEVARSDLDSRGLVLVSGLTGAAADSPIQVGDTMIGIFTGDFKESVTAVNFDETMETIMAAKLHATAAGDDTIEIELNRLVPKAKVKLVVEGDTHNGGEDQVIDALAGDNLRRLLMQHQLQLYDPTTHRLDQPHITGDCGGDGICGTCMVEVREGMEALNKVGPQESEIMNGRPVRWRAACKTVLGADNQEATIKIRLHPQSKWLKD